MICESLEWLIENQNEDGSWSSSACLRIPPPYEKNPDAIYNWNMNGKGGRSIILDRNRIFTTITVIDSLSRFIKKNYGI